MTNFMVSGNVSRDAITRTVTDKRGAKTLATDFHVAVKDGFGDSEITTFWKVTLWGQRGANIAPYLKKGKRVDVKGVPGQERPWVDQDGQTQPGSLTIKMAQVELSGKKAEGAPEANEFEGDEVE